MFFEVIPTTVFRDNGGALTYHAPFPLTPGQIVLIPLGRKQIVGIVWRQVAKVDFQTKDILGLVCPQALPKHLLDAIFWLSKYYLSPLPACANLMLPASLVGKKLIKQITEQPSTVQNRSPVAKNTTSEPVTPLAQEIKLNIHQQNALKALQQAPGSTRLLRGVTGSGKTNIYLKMASTTLTEGKSTILLVPEIALTSQLVQIFAKTFHDRVILIHSQQTLTERRKIWLEILEKTSQNGPIVVIGPRSALLTPVANLGLIIIDEAHEGTYYQENAPRYSALRLASFIAQTLKIPCIEGSATPNIVDYHLARSHQALVELTVKAKDTAITPEISVVDLKNRENFTKNRYFSDPLLTKIEKNLQDKHQTLIFHNRRGSSPLTLCENCSWQALCPDCYLPMTLDAENYLLTCHICGHQENVPSSCPECGKPGIIHKGFGTKLLETELNRLFPAAKIARFDGDNKKTDSLAALYQTVKEGQIDLLIGTQTLARGLDLPHLATVGIVQADTGLSLPDFSAEERTFELLNQVIGRVGRGHLDRAEVVIQTFQPDHPAIQTAIQSDFQAFADYLLKKRRSQHLPPFTYLARLAITYKTEKTTLSKIKQVYQQLAANHKLSVSPPMPGFHERTKNGFTWQIIIKSTSRAQLITALSPYRQFRIELDPPSLL